MPIDGFHIFRMKKRPANDINNLARFVSGRATVFESQLVRTGDMPSDLATTLLNGAAGETAEVVLHFVIMVSSK